MRLLCIESLIASIFEAIRNRREGRRPEEGEAKVHSKGSLTIPVQRRSPDELTTVNLQKSVCFSLAFAPADGPQKMYSRVSKDCAEKAKKSILPAPVPKMSFFD